MVVFWGIGGGMGIGVPINAGVEGGGFGLGVRRVVVMCGHFVRLFVCV